MSDILTPDDLANYIFNKYTISNNYNEWYISFNLLKKLFIENFILIKKI